MENKKEIEMLKEKINNLEETINKQNEQLEIFIALLLDIIDGDAESEQADYESEQEDWITDLQVKLDLVAEVLSDRTGETIERTHVIKMVMLDMDIHFSRNMEDDIREYESIAGDDYDLEECIYDILECDEELFQIFVCSLFHVMKVCKAKIDD